MDKCRLCPRECGVNRESDYGFCGCGKNIKAAGVYLHKWEEPCISGNGGSGTIFFSGCTLRCVYCQNSKISNGGYGKEITPDRLAGLILKLQSDGAENISLVTPTHFTEGILCALKEVKPMLDIPVVYNCGGYESVETLKRYEGYVDVYMPDFKYFDNSLANKYSSVSDYREKTTQAIREMLRQTGKPQFCGSMLKRGVLVRHLVLPTHYRDSIDVLEHLKSEFGTESFILSVMSQFTPNEYCRDYPEIDRRITTYEYNKVREYAANLGFTGYAQDKSSAKSEYTPKFELEGL